MDKALHFIKDRFLGTGSTIQQPRAAATMVGFHLDIRANFQADGFLDAPAFLPRGGSLAKDIGDLRLEEGYVEREPGAFGDVCHA